MIDFVHLENRDPLCVAHCKEKIIFRLSCWLETGEMRYPQKESRYGQMFTLALDKNTNQEYLSISGSLHKFYNDYTKRENQNYDDFSYSSVCKAIILLENYIPFPSKTKIKSMEIGINLNVGMAPNDFIKKMILSNKNTANENKKLPNKGLQKVFERDSYNFKIYNKSSESKKSIDSKPNSSELQDLVRIEIKLKDHDYCLTACGVQTLEELKKKETFIAICKLFKDHWSNILMVDSVKPGADWTESEKSYFNKSMVDGYFDSENFNSSQTRCTHYKKFIDFLDQKEYRSVYHTTTKLIDKKLSSLSL